MLRDDFARLVEVIGTTTAQLREAAAHLTLDEIAASVGVAALAVLVVATLVVSARRRRTAEARAAEAEERAEQANRQHAEERAFQERLVQSNHTLESQIAELKGRVTAMSEMGASRQSELSAHLEQRLEQLTGEMSRALAETRNELGRNLTENNARTSDHLSHLAERLAVIDTAQANLTELSSRVVSLQDVLANKQARGAFGQMRMETIIQDGLPENAYSFQPTLSNGKRPDCIIHLPNAPMGIVVDSKFPLEGFEALRQARTAEGDKAAARQIREHVGRHIDDIAGKYLIPGETQETALMFVPSEAAYADLHEQFADLIQKAHRARVFIVSPNMLMLAIQTMQAILKDVKVRQVAGLIQREVAYLLADVGRLGERVQDLERHFGLAGKSLEKVTTSAEKITARSRKIDALDLEETPIEGEAPGAKLVVGGSSGQ